MKDKIVHISRLLSKILRHQPELIGIQLDKQGWADTETLLLKLNEKGHKIDMPILEEVVANNNKQRFKFNEDKTKIRANQGHTIEIELGYEPVTPPDVLYHGTASKNLASIISKGILKGERHHVHLSADTKTAINVGSRHGKPIVLQVNASKMHQNGILFYQSENGVWLTDYVDSKYLSVHEIIP